MKRSLLFLGISLVLGVGFVILTTQPAEAVRTYRDADLSGSYYFVNMEIRQEWVGGVLVDESCSGFGRITFDGAGKATSIGTRRCSKSGTFINDSNTYTYAVDPDGSFLLLEDGYTDPTHCQITNKGGIILCDGVPRNAGIYSWIGIGVKE